ncbi:MAG: mannitol-1-phosphate 5-dehydrogenase [Fimbriimonadaceae bacterium]
MKKAVHFGAGNIGRGFLGQLYSESGYETVFVDVKPDVIHQLNEKRSYTIEIADDPPGEVEVKNVRGVDGTDLEAVAMELSDCNLASAAVGVGVLHLVAKPLALGFRERLRQSGGPLDVILAENRLNAAAYMRDLVEKELEPDEAEAARELLGFVEASVGRMVPVQCHEDPLKVSVEAYCELPVDQAGFKGEVPQIKHLAPRENFEAYVERKLFVHNAGHATAAYHAALRGLDTLDKAMRDKEVVAEVKAVQEQICLALYKKWNLPLGDLNDHAEDLRNRFANPRLQDQVARVGGDPLRKLGPHDRLVGALNLCATYEADPVPVAKAIAAALCYRNPNDPSAEDLRKMIEQEGPAKVLDEVCHLPMGELRELVLKQYEGLK